ncbi:hypothetical protein EQG49_01280 [Periweissella cryptocerci]|uniref:Glycosyltransferase family 1 protein n=1 Tax=Periweissella cryptocerci TaxID=2506420 RepID=A0A4P6YRE0_9LACO|nr:hypothetical protein [Periweissella cryptocerci]QBO35181.1 hypothetical protein EQG49_01280 [Periweissella cryptocerci]
MRKYIIHQDSHKVMSSGKVREDMVLIAARLGYEKLEEDVALETNADENDIILFAYPSRKGSEKADQKLIKHFKKNGARIIIVTLNVDYLRYEDVDSQLVVDTFNNVDVIITLSRKMQMRLAEDGVLTPMILLELHDYLATGAARRPLFEKHLIFAGSPYKAEYLQNWANTTPVDVFARPEAINDEELLANNVTYVGYLHPDHIAKVLNYGFGLAFDEDSATGNFAEYQTMNLSHKVSMFLAAGIPLILNAKAASAPMIEAAHAGVLIGSLDEIDDVMYNMTEQDYVHYSNGASRLSALVRHGFFYRKAIVEAEQIL